MERKPVCGYSVDIWILLSNKDILGDGGYTAIGSEAGGHHDSTP